MKCVDEFRNRDVATTLTDRLKKTVCLPWTIMEACGRQTHAIIRFDLNRRLPKNLTLVHGSSVTISFNRSNAPFAREGVSNRMLKKSASFVLASFRGSTYRSGRELLWQLGGGG